MPESGGPSILISADFHLLLPTTAAGSACIHELLGQPPRQLGPQTPGLEKEGKRISTRQPLEVIDALAGDAGALVPFVAAAAGALSGAPG